jgi:23S rRNA-/tRNA-specific pseudouridylate synthase
VPLLPVDDQLAIDLWYEGPTFLIADKPFGIPVYPAKSQSQGTLVNALLQSNRWLAEMETSVSPGVIHVLRPEDRGLTLVAKSDDMASDLRELYQKGAITFSYRVQVPCSISPRATDAARIFDTHAYGDLTVYDIDSPLGDTEELARIWLGTEAMSPARFICYRMTVPTSTKAFQIGLGERILLPDVDLYTAPT